MSPTAAVAAASHRPGAVEYKFDPELYKNGAEAKRISVERKEVEQLLARSYDEWDTIQSEIEKVRNES